MTKYHIHASLATFSRAISLYFVKIGQPGERSLIAKPLEFEPLPDPMSDALTCPAVSIQPEEAQMLMDTLWNCGVRPSEGSGSAGAMAATQKHLEDMRRLVFEQPVITETRTVIEK